MKKCVKRVLTAALSAVLAFCALGCDKTRPSLFAAKPSPTAAVSEAPLLIMPQPLPSATHVDKPFTEMFYTRPDTEAIASAILALIEKIESGETPDRLAVDYVKTKALYDSADSACSLAYLLYARDVTAPYYEQEYTLLEADLAALNLGMTDATVALCESSEDARQWVIDTYGEGFLDAAYADEALASDDLTPLLETERALVTEYDRLCATFVLQDGTKRWTLDEIRLDSTLTRDEYNRLYSAYCAAFNVEAGDIFIRLRDVRNEISRKLGYGSYAAYCYENYGRDFTVTDAKALHAAVKKYITPVFLSIYGMTPEDSAAIAQQEDARDGLPAEWRDFIDTLFIQPEAERDGSLDLYTLGLATYDLDTCMKAFSAATLDFSPSLYEAFSYMQRNGLYDFSVSPKKMDTSFATYFPDYNAPFIITQWNNDAQSVSTVIHELGHYFNFYQNPFCGWNQNGSLDLAEIDSQALELLMFPYYPQLYGDALAEPAKYEALLDSVYAVISGCMEDEFQQTVYANPSMSLEEMNAMYLQLSKEYGLCELYKISGMEWSLVPHTFQSPMYYISYAVSMIPALELWKLSQKDAAKARTAYLEILNRAPYEGFCEILENNGLPDVFDESTCKNLATLLQEQF